MRILKTKIQTETVAKNSRFIAELFPCETQADARKILRAQKQKYFDARHVVHAFVIGDNAEILGASDDGEPAGTAARPALCALKASGVVNVALTIARYFGGTLLGTGGLVRAYSHAAKAVLQKACEQGALLQFVAQKKIAFDCEYDERENLRKLFEKFSASEVREDFGEKVRLCAKIPAEQCETFVLAAKDLFKGKAKFEILSE